MNIISRAAWGARPPRSRFLSKANEVFLHHTGGAGSGESYMRQMQNQHMAPGWAGTKDGGSDIAYNFAIDPADFRVFEGRGWGVAPGAQKGYNVGTLAIVVMGNFETRQPTQGLLDVIANLIRIGHQLGHIPLVLTGGHRDAPNQSTACPGGLLHARIPDIRNLLEGTTVKPPAWARDATQWHIDRGIYSGRVDDVDEDLEFHRQTVFRHRFYNAIKSEFGSSGSHDHDGRYVRNVIVSR